jgi:hypothetical protein
MTAEAQATTFDPVRQVDDDGPASPVSSASATGGLSLGTALIGAAVVGSVASKARADNRMTRRMPRGFSIKVSNDSTQRNAAEVKAQQSAATAPITAKDAARFLSQ